MAGAAKAFTKALGLTSERSYLYMLEDDFPDVLQSLPGVGLGMFSDDVMESVNTLIKKIYIGTKKWAG